MTNNPLPARTAEVVEVYSNDVWVEDDVLGNSKIRVCSQMPGSEAVSVAAVYGGYPYVDNATRYRLADAIAAMFGAPSPVEHRFAEIKPYTPPPDPEKEALLRDVAALRAFATTMLSAVLSRSDTQEMWASPGVDTDSIRHAAVENGLINEAGDVLPRMEQAGPSSDGSTP